MMLQLEEMSVKKNHSLNKWSDYSAVFVAFITLKQFK